MHKFALLYSKKEIQHFNQSIVGICGIGGYGCMLIDSLARYDLKEIRLADPDYFEASNMDRQCLARFNTLGKQKVEIAQDEIKNVTAQTQTTCFHNGITLGCVSKFCKNSNAIVDICDKLSARLLLHIFCSEHGIPLVVGGSRAWPNRAGVKVDIYRYDKKLKWNFDLFPFQEWGILKKSWQNLQDELSQNNLNIIDHENFIFRDNNPPSLYGKKSVISGKVSGGYDPLKILSLTTDILGSLLSILTRREINHHESLINLY